MVPLSAVALSCLAAFAPPVVISLTKTDAGYAAKHLTAMLGSGAGVLVDKPSNTVIVTKVTVAQAQEARAYARRLDVISRSRPLNTHVVRLQTVDAVVVCGTFRVGSALAAVLGFDPGIAVASDPRLNALILFATQSDADTVLTLVRRLDRSGR